MTLSVLAIRRLPSAEGLAFPAYQSAEAAGFDLSAALGETETIELAPGARALIPTGLIFELPPGTEAQIRPRSGLALSAGVTVLNAPGTIDSDYRGEVKVLLVNLGAEPFKVLRGMRIAQCVVAPVLRVGIVVSETTRDTDRGTGGFGSTGL